MKAYFLPCLIVFALLSSLLPQPASAAVHPEVLSESLALDCDVSNIICLEEDLTVNETWTSDNVYVLSRDIAIPSGVTLTIEPGTVIKSSSRGLEISGSLDASGTAEAPIIFTSLHDDTAGGDTNDNGDASSPRASNWDNLQFLPGSNGRLSHVEIRYFGYVSQRRGGIYIEGSSVDIANVKLRDGYNNEPAISTTIDNIPPISNVTVLGMQYAGVGIREGTVTGDITLPDQKVIYYLLDDLTIAAGASLTVDPGVLVKARSARILVQGSLAVNGTAEAMAVFTSYRDDRIDGDSNHNGFDGNVRTDWDGIQFENGSQGTLDYVEIRHARGGETSSAIHVDRAVVAVTNCVLTRNNNALGKTEPSAQITISNCDIYENFNDGIVNRGTTPITATDNWWGNTAGPDDRSDDDGVENESPEGQDVSDYVSYTPWVSNKIFPELTLSETELAFSATEGGNNPMAPAVSTDSATAAALSWSVTPSEPWITVAQPSGSAGEPLTIGVDTAGLTPDDYEGFVMVEWDQEPISRVEYVEVNLEVVTPAVASPGFNIDPSALFFFVREGQTAPPPIDFTIANTGTGTLDWTATTDLPWVTLAQSSGTANTTVQVTANTDGLAEGEYEGEILLESPNAINSPYRVPTRLTVGCRDSQAMDVVLVIDRSGSMGSADKLGRAKDAAAGFLKLLDFSREQVSLVAFDSDSVLETELSQNPAATEQAIQSLESRGGTSINSALAQAREEALSNRHISGNLPVILLLSDGEDGRPEEAIAEAFIAKAQGIYIVTIGLGTNVDEAVMKEIASFEKDYHFAPEADELSVIYNQIAVTVGCNVVGTGVEQLFLPVTQ